MPKRSVQYLKLPFFAVLQFNYGEKLNKMDALKLILDAEKQLVENGAFERAERIAFENQKKVMSAFREFKVSDSYFAGTSGYGYDDRGRDMLDKIYARVFEAEDAFVRYSIVNGTQTLSIGLYGILRPGDIMLSVTGKPYDTLEEVIGIRGESGNGSLKDLGVKYLQTEMTGCEIDYDRVKEILQTQKSVKMVFIQRSKGYAVRETLSSEKIGEIVKFCKGIKPDVYVVVDNCYGEFCDEHEPTYYGADLVMGSLIKNPGGGIAECGGYLAGTKKAIELCSYRLTCPGIGLECGATLGQNKSLYKGLFYAPHTVCQSLKTAMLASQVYKNLGYEVFPQPTDERHCIIQTISLETEQKLLDFCRGIQAGSPVDAHVTPEPYEMPGYAVPVVMAAGAFTQGSSIELSADAPCKEPYTVYLQGGLTYESGKIGIMFAVENTEGR